jgi:hypothetical protein
VAHGFGRRDLSDLDPRAAPRFHWGAWQLVTVHSELSVGNWTSIAVDSFGNPHISWEYSWYGDLYYAHFETSTGVGPAPDAAARVVFHPASPSAFAPSTSLGSSLFEPDLARLVVDDAQGTQVRRLLDGAFGARCLVYVLNQNGTRRVQD